MFESDNFDFDEEFLKDVDWKETEYCSQVVQSEDESIAKKCKYDIESTASLRPSLPRARKDLLLGILEGSQNGEKSLHKKCNAVEPLRTEQLRNLSEENSAKETIRSRKTLILDIFKKDASTAKQLLHKTLNPSQSTRNNRDKETNKISPVSGKLELKSPTKKLPLIRKFPGPAGLFPDSLNGAALSVAYLNTMDENENEHENSKTSGFCSQNTKNLFSEGAWKLMADDIPRDYLKGHDISTIKQKARAKCFANGKIPILAAVVQHIDYNSENPRVILKDFTDVIEGIIHRSILSKYPNILRSGAVLLLNDVGIIMTAPWSTCLIMISLRSIVNVYSSMDKIEISATTSNARATKSPESAESFNRNPFESGNFDIEDSKMFDWNEDVKTTESKEESDPLCQQTTVNTSSQKSTTIRSKLLKFRSKDTLTPSIASESVAATSSALFKENNSPNVNVKSPHEDWAASLMNDSENDTDDELLSQLDVDSIVSNFNAPNVPSNLPRNYQ